MEHPLFLLKGLLRLEYRLWHWSLSIHIPANVENENTGHCYMIVTSHLEQCDAQTGPDKVMSIWSQWSSARQQHSQVATHNGLELVEDDSVHDGRVVTSPEPLETILVTKVYQLAEEWASLTNLDTESVSVNTML